MRSSRSGKELQLRAERRDNYERTKDVLAQIDKRAAVTESIVAENRRELLDTVRQLVIPEKPDINAQMQMELMKGLVQNPEGLGDAMAQMMAFAEEQERRKQE